MGRHMYGRLPKDHWPRGNREHDGTAEAIVKTKTTGNSSERQPKAAGGSEDSGRQTMEGIGRDQRKSAPAMKRNDDGGQRRQQTRANTGNKWGKIPQQVSGEKLERKGGEKNPEWTCMERPGKPCNHRKTEK